MSSFDSERSTTDSADYFQDNDPRKSLVEKIANIFTMLINENKNLSRYERIIKRQTKMLFSALEKPEITIVDYLIRIIQYSKAEESTLVNALIYIDRVCLMNSIVITEYNIHRLLFSSILLSIKYNEDRYYESEYYGQIAGVAKNELLALEYEFLTMINFNLFIDEKEYIRYLNSLKSVNAKEQKC